LRDLTSGATLMKPSPLEVSFTFQPANERDNGKHPDQTVESGMCRVSRGSWPWPSVSTACPDLDWFTLLLLDILLGKRGCEHVRRTEPSHGNMQWPALERLFAGIASGRIEKLKTRVT